MTERGSAEDGAAREGPLVLADISGYTTFVATTELEHSQMAVGYLLEAMIASFDGKLEPGQVQGDAVLFVSDRFDPRLLSWIEDAYVEFHRMVRSLLARSTCGCRACAAIPALTMKALAHYGRYSRRRIGPSDQLHGADVIIPHRLAKNEVPSREYVLVTQALIERLPEPDRARFTSRDEDGGEFGRLHVGYYDLGFLRTRT